MLHLKPFSPWKWRFTFLFSLFLLGIWIGTSSCGPSGTEEQEETVQLPDSLQTAQQFAQFGTAQMYRAYNFELAGVALKKATEMDPNVSLGQMQYGWFLNLSGEDEAAAMHMAKATEVDPQNPLWQAWQAWHCMWMENYDCTDEHVDAALAIDSSFHWAHYVNGLKMIQQGQPEEAIAHMEKAYSGPQQKSGLALAHARAGNKEKALEIVDTLAASGNPFDLLGIGETYMALGDQDAALEWAEKAYEQRHPFFPWLKVNPIFDPVREDERFKELMARVDLP